MNIVEIKGIVPGAGKTTTLVKAFVKSNLKHKVILTPTNKARQVCIQKLIEEGYDPKKVQKAVQTMKSFKHNFYNCKGLKRHFDIESTEWIEETSEERYFPCHTTPKYKFPYNIFIDEASMISDVEMQDLLESRKIQNLVLDGDSLQFEPIGNSARIEKEGEVIDEWIDDGIPYNVEVNTQILLNKSMRARDSRLVEALEYIKEGKLVKGILKACTGNNPLWEYKKDDWNICYTNKLCDHINSIYTNPTRMIVAKDDKPRGFYTSEILELDDERFKQLKKDLEYEGLNNDKALDFETWKNMHLKPAYAITCHKMQGSTISEGNVYIHLRDMVYGLKESENLTEWMRARLFQKFLYVAISRAISVDQITIMGLGKNDFYHSHDSTPMYKDKKDGEWKNVEGCESLLDEIFTLEELVGPMVDESIKKDAKEYAADDKEVVQYILDNLEYDTSKASILKGEDEAKKKYREERRGYSDETLLNMTWEEITEKSKDAGVRRRWHDLHSNFGSRCQNANIKSFSDLDSKSDTDREIIVEKDPNLHNSYCKPELYPGELSNRFQTVSKSFGILESPIARCCVDLGGCKEI